MRRVRVTTGSLVVMLLVVLAACGSGPRSGPTPANAAVTVRVENRNFLDMNVYVLRGAQRVRMGTASGASTTVLTVPENVVFGSTSLRFQMDPIGGNATPVTQEVLISPGDEIVLIIP
jgi:hypothetical protein